MHQMNEIPSAELPRRRRRRPFGPWWMRQPPPSVFGSLIIPGIAIFVGLILPIVGNLLSGPDFSVRFVLPDEYVGEFQVVLDQEQGEDYALDGHEFVFRIPEDGILRVTSDGPLNTFELQSAEYEDGRPLVLELLGSDGTEHRYRVKRPTNRIQLNGRQ